MRSPHELPAMAIDANLDLAKARVRGAEKFAANCAPSSADAWQRHVHATTAGRSTSDLVDALAHGGVDVEEIRAQRLRVRRGNSAGHRTARSRRGRRREVHRRTRVAARLRRPDRRASSTRTSPKASWAPRSDIGMPLAWFTAERLRSFTELGIIDRFRVRLR